MILMTPVHFACLSLVGLTASILRYEWRGNWIFHKVPETSHTFCFTMSLMSFVHSSSLSLVQHKTNFRHYESLDNSIFQHLPCTAEIAAYMRFWYWQYIRQVFALYDPTRVFFRYEWRENSTFKKLTETTHNLLFCDDFDESCTFRKFLSSWTHNRSPFWVTEDLNFSESDGDKSYIQVYHDVDVSCTFCKFQSVTTENQFS